ncbi:MAG: SpoIIE family protein phosphatase [Candidatus Cloacimonetes bacterium]|nr:SpoIIE family protein phosphatase [Candidatus Cloacimonadota bacterium]
MHSIQDKRIAFLGAEEDFSVLKSLTIQDTCLDLEKLDADLTPDELDQISFEILFLDWHWVSLHLMDLGKWKGSRKVFLLYPHDKRVEPLVRKADDYLLTPLIPNHVLSFLKLHILNRPTILFADANPYSGNAVNSTFLNQNMDFLMALTSTETEKLIQNHCPQLLFLDFSMAEGFADRIIQQLKSNPYTKRMGIILLSGAIEVDAVEGYLNQGILHFVMKPYDESEILLMARYFLSRMVRGRETILVVDDSPVSVGLLKEFLEREQFEVVAFFDALEALEYAGKFPPSLITADYQMPKMDGWEFCRQIKQNPVTKDIPLVMISGGNGDLAYRKARILRVDDYISKPFTQNRLAYTINSVLLKHHMQKDEVNRQEMERELKIGIQMQENMLPQKTLEVLPVLKGEVWWVPARQLGGDFFEYCIEDKEASVFAVADVSGKGLSSALLATAGQACLRTSLKFTRSPAKLLETLNDFVHSIHQPDRFITAFVLQVDSVHKKIHWASAGHNGMIFLHRDLSYDSLSATGLPCGMSVSEEYEVQSLPFVSGDRLILFSDGVLETLDKQKVFYGRERFLGSLKDSAHLPLNKMLAHIRRDLQKFCNEGSQNDDITLLALELL